MPTTSETVSRGKGALVAATLLAAWGAVAVETRGSETLEGTAGSVVVLLGFGAVYAYAILWLRDWLLRGLAGVGRAAPALVGATAGVIFWLVAVPLDDPATIRGAARTVPLVCAMLGGALAPTLVARRPRLRRLLEGLVAIGVLAYCEVALPLRSHRWLRFALDGVFLASVASAAASRSFRASRRTTLAAGVGLVIAIVAAFVALRSMSVRHVVFHRSAHAWSLLAPHDAVRAGRPTVRPARQEGPARVRPRHGGGAAAGRDVLLLSIDALRWDATDALPRIRSALGPHAEFTRAVSPAPRTSDSLPATMRGRAYREVRFLPGPFPGKSTAWRDRSPTLAFALVHAGYRAVAVPTHRYLDPRTGILSGFDPLVPEGFASVLAGRKDASGVRPIVSAETALALVARQAASAHGPFAAWIHFMETHEPYRRADGRWGPATREGQRRSIRDLDRRLARFMGDFARLRGRDPVVVVFGDHGEEFGEHGSSFHSTSTYAEQVRVALLIASPGVPPGRYDAPVSTASIPPTLLDLLGFQVPPSMTEPTLLAPLHGEAPWPRLAVSELRFKGLSSIGYTGERYRLVVDPEHDIEELFDSDVDPLEQHDVSEQRPEALRAIRRLARAWDRAH